MESALSTYINHQEKIQQLAQKMYDPKEGVEVKDRKYHARTYEECFLGSDAVTWILKETGALTRQEALLIGDHMRKLGLFHHVVYEHDLEDDKLFYRFAGSRADSEDIPGTFGAPVVGETLQLQKDIVGFFRSRSYKYQGFYKSSLVFNKCAVFADADVIEKFYDDSQIQRTHSMPPHWVELFSGGDPKNATVNMIDGEVFRKRKAQLMKCFSRLAIEEYLPVIESVVISHLDKWKKEKEFKLTEKAKLWCVEVCSRVFLGVEPSETFSTLTDTLLQGFASFPVNLPGTTLSKALAARNKLANILMDILERNRKSPPEFKNALLYLLEEQKKPDSNLSDVVICSEVLHFLIAGISPVLTLLVYFLYELILHPQYRRVVEKEVNEVLPSGPITLEALSRMTFTGQMIMEVERYYGDHAVPLSWGKITKPVQARGHKIPAGWNAVGCWSGASFSERIYSKPELFDPTRFSPERAEDKRHPYGFVPLGYSGDVENKHGCAGYMLVPVLLKVFVVYLYRGKGAEMILVPGQNINVDSEIIPVVPKDGLKIQFHVQ